MLSARHGSILISLIAPSALTNLSSRPKHPLLAATLGISIRCTYTPPLPPERHRVTLRTPPPARFASPPRLLLLTRPTLSTKRLAHPTSLPNPLKNGLLMANGPFDALRYAPIFPLPVSPNSLAIKLTRKSVLFLSIATLFARP